MDIEILNRQKKIKIKNTKIKKITAKFLKHLKQRKDCFLNIIFVSPQEIKQINKRYFKRARITDVIAIEPGRFKNNLYGSYLGDIVICAQKAKENAKRFNAAREKEIILYVAHGILHLLGYDDLNEKGRLRMERVQKGLLSLL